MERDMARVRVHNFTISLDGYAAGPQQRLDAPLGEGGQRLHEWIFETRSGRAMIGREGGASGLNDETFHARTDGIGATIIGRNMFGPVRGPWPDESWRGWWGEKPPYGHDVYVLTHHARPSLPMQGGTTFHFVDASPQEALELAMTAAHGQDVTIGGGASTIRQFLDAGLIDDMHLVIAPVLLGAGERLFDPVLPGLAGYECADLACDGGVAHARITRTTAR
jgi:dihydrofolate reductase